MANHATSSKTTAALTSFAKRIPVKIQDQQEELASFPVSSNSDWSVTWAITKNPVQKASIALATCTVLPGAIMVAIPETLDFNYRDTLERLERVVPIIHDSNWEPRLVNV